MRTDIDFELIMFRFFDLAMENPGRMVDITLEPGWQLFGYASPNHMLFRLESHRASLMTERDWTLLLEHLPMNVPLIHPMLLPSQEEDSKIVAERWTWILYKCPVCGSARVLDQWLELVECKHCRSKKKPDVIHELIP